MPAKEKKTKAQIAAAATAGARTKKKKWAKGKRIEKAKNTVCFDETLLTKFNEDVPKMRLITPHILCEKMKITISLARSGMKNLEKAGKIKRVSGSAGSMIYSRI